MAYQPLKLDPGSPPQVTKLIRLNVESYFRDVHTMLRLLLPDNDLLAGCNFAVTQILASVVGGVSATLYGEKGHKGRLFKEVLRKSYPWPLEVANTVKPGRGAEIIYTLFRNPLTHKLGLDPPNSL